MHNLQQSAIPAVLMNNRELKLFIHLAESLHFGSTSRACHTTPSTLTRTIQRLEEEVGEPLFVRDNRSVMLTPAGSVFKKYALDVVSRWQKLQANLASDERLRGDISLYCSVTAAYSILPSILGKFRAEYPDVHINLETGDVAKALTRLLNDEFDIAIAAQPARQPSRVRFMKIAETPLVFIAPEKFPEIVVQKGKPIDWQKTPVIMAERGLSRERLDRWFKTHKVSPNIYAHVAGNEAIIAMVSLGCGIAVVPRLVLEKSPLQDQVAILENTPRLEPFSIGVCAMNKNMTNPKIRAFWAVAEQEAQGGG